MKDQSESTTTVPELGCDALLAYKRRLFATAEETTIGGDGMFAGMKVKTLTLPLPEGVIGLLGDTPENAVFVKANVKADPAREKTL